MQQTNFTPSMIAGCEAALDAGVFYQDAFENFVIEHMGGFDCEAKLATTLRIDLRSSEESARSVFEMTQPLEAEIAAMPRGHYAIIQTLHKHGSSFFKFVVADGSGKLSTGGRYDTYDAEPSAEHVLRKMLGYEIYLCRKLVEQRRETVRDIAAMTSLDIHVGMKIKIKDYRAPGEVKPFSSATVIEVHPETGTFKLMLMRRGTSKRWTHTVGAARLKSLLADVATPSTSAPC
ncbi:MAG: hypothetical protein ACYC3W_02240 [Candidatus Nanopelagicales bacterium]